MARVLPFVGTRFNPKAVDDLASVMAPPYDVINDAMREDLYGASVFNIVRLILGKEQVDDDEYHNKYQRAASLLKEWKSGGVLMDDPCKNFYVYQQVFSTPEGKEYTRTGFFAAIKLEDPEKGRIKGHEMTFSGPKEDRLKLLRSTRCNLSPIFCLYSDPAREADAILESVTSKEAPRMEVTTESDGVTHRLWLLSSSTKVKHLSALMQDRGFCIADGHHRYETAVRYAQEMNRGARRRGERPPHAYTLAFLANSEAEGTVILPTHRVLSSDLGDDIDYEEILEDLEAHFDVSPVKVDLKKPEKEGPRLVSKLEKTAKDRTAFIMVLPNGKGYHLALREGACVADDMPEGLDSEIARLDVSVLHHYIISQVWVGNPEVELDDQDVFYVKDGAAALAMLKGREQASAVFLMNAPRMDQVWAISNRNLRMPHKTTFFYPKLLTGMVVRDHSTPW